MHLWHGFETRAKCMFGTLSQSVLNDNEQLPQEITLAEIEHRRERLRPLRKQETQLQADTEAIATASDAVNVKTIELDDVAHVIRAIKEEQQPMAIQGKVINEDDVAHVIKAIKSDAIGQVDDEHGPLEVIELPEPVKREQPAEALDTAYNVNRLQVAGGQIDHRCGRSIPGNARFRCREPCRATSWRSRSGPRQSRP